MKQLILASASPARKELLKRMGLPFIAIASNYEEDMTLQLAPTELAIYLSQGKARDVARHHKNAVVLGADSFAVCDNQLLGKPHSIEKARATLKLLSGRQHTFVTGFTIIDTDTAQEYSAAVETIVYFRKLSAGDIAGYLAKEDVLEKAGAYIIQELGSVLIEKINGSASNITGLPMAQVAQALEAFDIHFL